MPVLSEQELNKQIANADIQSLYFLYGLETYSAKRTANKLIKKAAGTELQAFNLNTFGNTAEAEQIIAAVEAMPMMQERKCVAVSDYNLEEKQAAETEMLYQLIADVPDYTTLVLYYPTLTFGGKQISAKWKKFIHACNKTGIVVEFERKGAADLQKLMIREAEKAGCALSKSNAKYLHEAVGNEIRALQSEVHKLCAFLDYKGEITSALIDQMVAKSMEATVFLLADAIVAGNYEKAYLYTDQLFFQKEEPVAVLAVLSRTYIDIYRVYAAVSAGHTEHAPAAYGEYKGKEFLLTKAGRNLKRMSAAALHKSLSILIQADLALKSSPQDNRIIFEKTIAKLLLVLNSHEK